eukprot:CAMPEP_0168238952 /NCGR_PEP_ID=MMETSP0140_2-20121125/21209_1 /TAXON_ID=44445 /ORGANISM="Pseudo-nitzschia australis, Strain 10249 10 AB" /LENGTH=200 /DNA_ID=CAMNT_0008173117 /DNA_START=67 /DNA_END=673 /DNA_ORIENTATION=+
MTFLDKPVCNFCCCGMLSKTSSATTIGDIFKLILSAAAGIGLSVAIYSFHRKTSSFAVEENYAESGNDGNGDGEHGGEESPQNTSATIPTEQQQQRQRVLRIHAILSLSGAIMSIVLLIFFGVFASDLDKCAHETCGADVSWSCITLVISLSWMGVTYLGHRHLQRQRERERQRIRLPENEKGTNRAVGSDENGEGSEIP